MAWYFVLLVALAVATLPFLAGTYLARLWRMPDHGWKIGIVLFAIAASVAICVLGWPPKLGIDLRGGVILVYEVDKTQTVDPQYDMNKLVGAITRRVNPGGVKEVSVRPFGDDQVEIIIPEADEAETERIKRKISSIGTLEFRITANRRDHADIIAQAEKSTARELRGNEGPIARWVPLEEKAAQEFAQSADYVTRLDDQKRREVLVVIDPYNVTGDYLYRATPDVDDQGRPAVSFRFDGSGAKLFGGLTGDNVPDRVDGFERHLGIILDGFMYSAPSIRSTIFADGIITGSFTQDQVDELAAVLTAGSLPATLYPEPISTLLTGPTLGQDTIQKGETSMIAATVVVAIFMAVYYRFAGLVACLALTLNILVVLAVMITIKAAFTLPGLAGLVLTVGMAVDANVLIYERMREELARGATLRMTIRNGFDRAMSAIVDSNITTLITAVVLYVIGTDQVKGFAVTLFLGLTASMFTAIFCARVLFDIAEKRRWLTELRMMRILGETHFDFYGVRRPAIAASIVLIVAGLIFVGMRGRDLLDIDFTGGVSAEILFKEAQEIADVRATAEKALDDVVVSDVRITGEPRGKRFLINTSELNDEEVRVSLRTAFAGKLASNSFKIGPLAMIEPSAGQPGASERARIEPPPATETPTPDSPPEEPSSPAAPESPPASEQDPTAAPPEGSQKQSRAGAASEQWLAFADDAAAESPQGDAPAEPAAQTEPEPSSQAQKAAPQEATSEAKPDAEPAQVTTAATDEKPPETNPTPPPSETPGGTPPTPSAAAEGQSAGTLAATDLFAGGTRTRLTFTYGVTHDTVLDKLNKYFPGARFRASHPRHIEGSSTARTQWDVDISLPPAQVGPGLAKFQRELAATPFFGSSNQIGGAVAGATRWQAIYAIVTSLIFIVIYLWIRFQRVVFGFAAVVAVIHDVLVALGALAASLYLAPYLGFLMVDPFKINLSIIAAFLTIIGFSLNDTIVIFDRLREIRGKSPELTVDMVNLGINQTLGRTLLTSFTAILAVVILYVAGGQGIHAFAFTMLVGMISGVYSTVYIACPVVLLFRGPAAGSAVAKQVRAARVAAS